jgi:hypothetical protein
MGGVDLTNHFISDYSPSISAKKLLVSFQKYAWRAAVHGRNQPLSQEGLDFLREIIQGVVLHIDGNVE